MPITTPRRRCSECLANGSHIVLGRNVAFQVSSWKFWRQLNRSGSFCHTNSTLLYVQLAETFRYSPEDFLNCVFKTNQCPVTNQCHFPGGNGTSELLRETIQQGISEGKSGLFLSCTFLFYFMFEHRLGISPRAPSILPSCSLAHKLKSIHTKAVFLCVRPLSKLPENGGL